jgi:predicted nucleic acid-binding protein
LIVADTNLIAYFLIKGPHTREAESVYNKDSKWIAPLLWRSEFRNLLILSLRRGILSLEEAIDLMGQAETLMGGHEHQIVSWRILRLAANSGCSAYDCEFAALALHLGIPLVTSDGALLANFKSVAVSMKSFIS